MTEIEFCEQSVAKAEAAQRLMQSEDFKKVFSEPYEAKLLEIGYSYYHLEGERREQANKEQECIGYIFDTLYTTLSDGNAAKEQLEMLMSEEEGLNG